MRILVLGGTAWLGHTIAAASVRGGHQVTCLARGTGVPPGVRLVRADRDQDSALAEVATERWDAVIDVARQPAHVRRAVRDLRDTADRYLFVSTGNVYASQAEIGADEDAELLPPLSTEVMEAPEDYGPAKVACENAVIEGFGPERSVIARAGLIGGPGDPSGRTSYWVQRFASPSNDAGAVLVPHAPHFPTALIDVRDLAEWLLLLAGGHHGGIFNAFGASIPFPEHIDIARVVTGHTGPVVAVPERWLLEQGGRQWSGERSLPLWLVDRDWYGMNARSTTRAIAAGLRLRPLRETLADTAAQDLPGVHGPLDAGLTDDEERSLLDTFAG
ncbi:oxidoreductase [Arthrobacter sp. RIT-PI-e]|uniref:NAD-dependent epimerase/dehydratase family protein n=1 Tax=Arthrobacter sp. RIT-PI-e TaxID=1681197 RepID=UPI00067680AF|nr:NAD-dependent epimerase/dehydratase family protein [Arthrobacter sp. RIT-PI-e]KNC20218.1 oxidoreductase [Arthrobacter sp. RIT-PI-e]